MTIPGPTWHAGAIMMTGYDRLGPVSQAFGSPEAEAAALALTGPQLDMISCRGVKETPTPMAAGAGCAQAA